MNQRDYDELKPAELESLSFKSQVFFVSSTLLLLFLVIRTEIDRVDTTGTNTLSGTLFDATTGDGIPGALIEIRLLGVEGCDNPHLVIADGIQHTTWTDSNGRFKVNQIRLGDYEVTTWSSGNGRKNSRLKSDQRRASDRITFDKQHQIREVDLSF
jgi:hypothetical protein